MNISLLTSSQKEVYQKFVQFLLDPNDKNFIIQGSAGTGKSFLTKYLVEDGIANYKSSCRALGLPIKYKDYAVCATTNKAVEALDSQIDLPEGKSITTLTSLLKLHLEYRKSAHKQVLVPNFNCTVIKDTIVFIDECSMISKDAFSYINTLFDNCKLVFIGDKYQLPPVKENQSAIYGFNYPEATLSEPVRNAGNTHLIALCEQLKNTCETGVWHDIHSVPGSIEVIKDGSEMNKIFDKYFSKPDPSQRILAYSNQMVTNYAQYIMQLRGQTEYLEAGSWYSSNQFYISSDFRPNQKLNIDSLVQIKAIRRKVGKKVYDLYGINDENLINNNVLNAVKVYSPKLNLTWCDYVFSNPDYYFQYMKKLEKSNYELFIKAKNETLDLRPIESCTIHKAQGSTLDTVFIDLYDISTCRQKELTAKLLYVAASRARKKIVFYGELNKRYGVKVE